MSCAAYQDSPVNAQSPNTIAVTTRPVRLLV